MSGYTIVEHDLMDSEAARLVSAGARCVLFDFVRRWSRITHNGQQPVSSIMFTWAGSCDWPVSRKTWEGYRAELLEKGFLVPGPPFSGRYGFSPGWKQYRPTNAERTELAVHDDRRRCRCEQTKAARASKSLPFSEYKPPTGGEDRVARAQA